MNSPRSPQTPLSSELKKIINDRNVLSMRSRMKGMQLISIRILIVYFLIY